MSEEPEVSRAGIQLLPPALLFNARDECIPLLPIPCRAKRLQPLLGDEGTKRLADLSSPAGPGAHLSLPPSASLSFICPLNAEQEKIPQMGFSALACSRQLEVELSPCQVFCAGPTPPKRCCGSAPRYLYGANHRAKGKDRGRVPQRGLAVKRALRIHQQHCDLRGRESHISWQQKSPGPGIRRGKNNALIMVGGLISCPLQ